VACSFVSLFTDMAEQIYTIKGVLNSENQFTEDPELEAIKARVIEMEQEAEKLREVQYEPESRLLYSPQAGESAQVARTWARPHLRPHASSLPKDPHRSRAPAVCDSLKDHDSSSYRSDDFSGLFACDDLVFPGIFYSMTHEERIDADNRSVYVGNVDYGTTADELEIHFNGCGHVNRVTILCDKFTGHPKGFAYIEFSDRESVRTAMALDETLFRGRVIKVMPKRTNMPGISTTDRGFLRGGRFRGRGFRGSRFNNGFQGRFRGFSRSELCRFNADNPY
ncbi:hypothetical protein P4O66_021967, partial [Electrophorus voltai]